MLAYHSAHVNQFLRMFQAKVPKFINFEQTQRGMDIAQEILTTFNDNPDLLKKIITGNESWVYGYDIESKAQSSQQKRPDKQIPKKVRQVR